MPRVMPGVVFKNKKRRDARALQKEELNRKRRDAYAAGRQLGRVTKCARTKHWHAKFQFNRNGERTSTYGPLRASRDAAEQDRERIAAKMKAMKAMVTPMKRVFIQKSFRHCLHARRFVIRN